MNPSSKTDSPRFAVVSPGHAAINETVARILHRHAALRFIAMGTRRCAPEIPPELNRLNPAIGLVTYITARTMSTYNAEAFRFRLHPWFDNWVKRRMQPGDHVFSSYGYANECFRFARRHGGKTLLDGGSSHPEYFWSVLGEEYRRWGSAHPPVAEHHYRRSVEMMDDVDFVLSPSGFVTRSFLERGFKPKQIIHHAYPINLSCFSPAATPRPANRPLTLISTGTLTLRKGTPYMLEAFRIIHRKIPTARLLLTRVMFDNVVPIIEKYSDLPIDWSPGLPHPQLAERLRSADIFLLPSLEDGLAFTVIEALACGLPAITTPNTGASDLIQPGVNGEIVPIRDPQAIADVVFKWADKILTPGWQPKQLVDPELVSFDHFERTFMYGLRRVGLVGNGVED